MKSLNVSLKTVARIAELNKEYREKYEKSESTSGKINTDRVLEAISDPLRAEMHKLIDELSLEQKQELSALVWMGRGDFDDFESAFEYAKTLAGRGTANYLEAKPLFEYIPDGIATLEKEDIFLNN